MLRTFLIVVLLSFLSQYSFSQNRVTVDIGPMISAEWNLYHWYQRPNNHPFSIASGGNRSVGQVLNVLPSARLGIIFAFDIRTLKNGLNSYSEAVFLLEGGVSYMPFSFDLEERKGQGALSFPIVLSAIIPVGNAAITIGGGVQFSKTEYSDNTPKYKGLDNPFFISYVAEFGVGPSNLAERDYGFLFGYCFFARAGYGEHQAVTLDIGVKASIGIAIPTN